jgi:hypothetical protein
MYKINDFSAFLRYLDLDKDVCEILLDSFNILEKQGFIKSFYDKVKALESNNFPRTDYYLCLESLDDLVANTEISPYTAKFIFICMCAPYAYNNLVKLGFDEDIIKNSFSDYKIKLQECLDVYNIAGTFVAPWFLGLIHGRCIKLGRLQFATENTKCDYNKFGLNIKSGDPVVAIHIPSGEKLTFESVMNSLDLAYKHFNAKGNMAFTCHTPFLYNDYVNVFNKGNIKKFIDLFEVVDNHQDETFSNCWRFFNCNYDGKPDNLPNNNSLQNSFINHIKNNGTHGYGFGYLVFDGKAVLTKKQN